MRAPDRPWARPLHRNVESGLVRVHAWGMRAEAILTHDVHNFYIRWEIIPEGRERAMLAALGGPVFLELETSCVIDQSGNRHETTKTKLPIWPFPGSNNRGQARFYDTDSRRRFWVNLQDAVGTTVVDWLFEARPGSVGADGKIIAVAEGVRPAAPAAPTPSAS